MSAVPHPSFPVPSYPQKNTASSRHNLNRQKISKENTVTTNVSHISPISNRNLTRPKRLPAELQILLLLQKGSFILAFTLIATNISVYLSTVRIPQLWSQEYRNLETLQRQERQLTVTNETLKHQMAQQAGKEEKDLVPLTTANVIFMKPASTVTPPNIDLSQKDNNQLVARDITLGY
jgi:hypothetical protein